MAQIGLIDGFNPPLPSGKSDTSSSITSSRMDNKSGQRLLSQVRALENKTEAEEFDDALTDRVEEIVEILDNLLSIYSRRGLLQGDTSKANHILSSHRVTNSRDKRGSRKSVNTSDLNSKHADDVHDSKISPGSNMQPDETFVLSALIRILGGTREQNRTNLTSNALAHQHTALIRYAAEICVAIGERVKSSMDHDTCTVAEYELIAQSGKPLLTGLLRSMQTILAAICNCFPNDRGLHSKNSTSCLSMVVLDDQNKLVPLISCIKAACSLVTLFGTKLSRSAALLSDLDGIAWRLLSLPHDSIQRAAARLIASIPISGGNDRKTPSDIWNLAVVHTTSSLFAMIEIIAPLKNSNRKKSKHSGQSVSQNPHAIVEEWIENIRDITQVEDRVNACYWCIGGLTRCLESLLAGDTHGTTAQLLLIGAKLDLATILDLVERFLSFPLTSEAVFFRTKKRLRSETIEGGVLSPTAAVAQMASRVKALGHDIMNSLISAVGGSVLLPYARRIMRITYAALLTSSSGPVRKVLDPTNAIQLDGKKRRWLHTSIRLRSMSIRTFNKVIIVFGCDKCGNSKASHGVSPQGSSVGEKGAALIVGCLVEQINWRVTEGHEELDGDWGSISERVRLVLCGVEALKATLFSCRGFLSSASRSLIDSIAVTGLNAMIGFSPSCVCSCSSVKVAFLDFASSCLVTPLADGAASSVVDTLVHVARQCIIGDDINVSLASRKALCLCDSYAVPRASALKIVTRTTTENSGTTASNIDSTSAEKLMENIRNAQAVSFANESKKNKKDHASAPSLKRMKANDSVASGGSEPERNLSSNLKDVAAAVEVAQEEVVTTGTIRKSTTKTGLDVEEDKVSSAGDELKNVHVTKQIDSAPRNCDVSTNAELPSSDHAEASDHAGKKAEVTDASLRNADTAESSEEELPDMIVDGGPDSEDE